MSSSHSEARPWTWRFVVGTGAGCAVAFAGSAFLTLVLREASVGAQSTVTAGPKMHPNSQASFLHTVHATAMEAAATPVRTERLSGAVMHNPFAPLNEGPPAPPAIAAPAPGPKPPEPSQPVVAAIVPPPLPPPPPASPTAPPLPFVAVGSIQGAQVTDGHPLAFIRQHDQLMVVRAGDTIGQTYKVEAISVGTIELTYLPLMQRQTLALAP